MGLRDRLRTRMHAILDGEGRVPPLRRRGRLDPNNFAGQRVRPDPIQLYNQQISSLVPDDVDPTISLRDALK